MRGNHSGKAHALALAVISCAVSCSGAKHSAGRDAGHQGGSPHDAAAKPQLDATVAHLDAGSTRLDAGLPRRDAGGTSMDAATRRDAGRSRRDAGGSARDAGNGTPDTGAMHADTGASAQHDAGKPSATCTGTERYDAFVSDPKLCVYVFTKNLSSPRQMAFAPNGDLFVNNGNVTVLWDADGNGTSDPDERAQFGTASGLRHGLAFSPDHKFVYASSQTNVYRWAYTSGARAATAGAETVIKNIPTGGHDTRTLQFDSQGRLYVNIGSGSNVDETQDLWNTRAQVRRYTLPATLPSGGLDYGDGGVFASGMRNEVGLFVDAQDRLWGVENGRDDLSDADFGGDIHNDNPGEEINLIDGSGAHFYGYPFCYSEFKITGGNGASTQWADESIATGDRKTDAWCRDSNNVHPPMFVLQAHSAPLGIVQYTGSALPFTNDFIVASHGSWDRQPAVGRVVYRAHYDGHAITSAEEIMGEKKSDGTLAQGGWDARPVDVQQGPDQALYVSDDSGGRVFKLGYQQ